MRAVPRRTRQPKTKAPPRIRRTAAAAREAILDAAERRLSEGGLAGIRIQEVAADVGVSHPTVLHHFGSRAGLIEAVVERSTAALQADLVRAFRDSASGGISIVTMIEQAFSVFAAGHARVIAWLALEGHTLGEQGGRIRDVARAAHEARRAHAPQAQTSFEDTYFTVLLAAFALFGDAVVGPLARDEADPRADARKGAAFRDWLARLITEHLQRAAP